MKIALEKNQFYLDVLRNNTLFKDVPQASLEKLLEISAAQKWDIKTCVLNTDKTLYTFYIIISGKIKVYNVDKQNDRHLTLFILTEHDAFDVCTLVNGCSHRVFYETLSTTEVLAIPIYQMKNWVEDNIYILQSFLQYLINKIHVLEEFVTDVCLEDTSTRLAKLLIKHMNTKTYQIQLIGDLSHNELAELIGTTRAVINRHLQEFKKEGIVKIERKYLEITNLRLLLDKVAITNY